MHNRPFNPGTPSMRLRLRQYHEESTRLFEQNLRQPFNAPRLSQPCLPDDLIDMQCGAKTRAGSACKLTAIYLSGRCKFHGGLSTGPKSEAGKNTARENGKKGGRPRKNERLGIYDKTEPHEYGKVMPRFVEKISPRIKWENFLKDVK